MSTIRKEVVYVAINRSHSLINIDTHDNFHKQIEFQKQTVLTDESLTEDEKTYAIRELNKIYDRGKLLYNEGTRRTCENCNQECLATLYCEYCVRNYLKAKFSNWTSGNNDIDNLIQKCQLEAIRPNVIIEWIPYNNFQNIEYLTKGGFSEIYKAVWINGKYEEWDSKKQQLERLGGQNVILKKLENVENANLRWFEEAESHFTICNKWSEIVQCYGLTQDPSNGNYMLVMNIMTTDLRTYLQQNHYQLTWKERIQIAYDITIAVERIHYENAIHRDLHSGNILYLLSSQKFSISDLGFCGPADKSSESIYGNLPYIAPEVISGKGTTKASDIYSIAILMWEISSGQPPFIINHEHNYDLAMNIINGIRPKIASGTPLEYKNLMKQCWDADPLKRPDIITLRKKMSEIILSYQNTPNELEENNSKILNKINTNLETNYTSSRLFTSKVHQFENFPEPRNATEEEQEAFHSKSYDNFHIPDYIDNLDKSNNQKKSSTSKISSIFKVNANSKRLSKLSKIFKRNPRNNDSTQNDYKSETIQQQIKNIKNDINDEDEINNPNLHSEEQEVNDFDKSSDNDTSKISDGSISKTFNELQINSKNDAQNDYNRKRTVQQQQQIKNIINIDDGDDIYNNSNFHSEEQDEFEIPDDTNKF